MSVFLSFSLQPVKSRLKKDNKTAPVDPEAEALLNSVSFLEFIDASAGIHEFLPAREEGMAFAADIHFQNVNILRRTRFEGLAACADDGYFVIFRMNSRFHFLSPRFFRIFFCLNTRLL